MLCGATATGLGMDPRGERDTVRSEVDFVRGQVSSTMPNWPSATEDSQTTTIASISARKLMARSTVIAALCDKFAP